MGRHGCSDLTSTGGNCVHSQTMTGLRHCLIAVLLSGRDCFAVRLPDRVWYQSCPCPQQQQLPHRLLRCPTGLGLAIIAPSSTGFHQGPSHSCVAALQAPVAVVPQQPQPVLTHCATAPHCLAGLSCPWWPPAGALASQAVLLPAEACP